MLQRFRGVPEPRFRTVELFEQGEVMVPAQLCKRRLHNLPVRPRRSKRSHVLQVARREALHLRECLAQIGRKTIDDPAAPALGALLLQNTAPEIPIQHHHDGIAGEHHAKTFLMDARLEVREPSGIVRGRVASGRRYGKHRAAVDAASLLALRYGSSLDDGARLLTRHTRSPSGLRR